MADYNAHTYFGNKCLEELGPERRRWLAADETAFQLGLYGPDPLTFSLVGHWKVKGYHEYWREEVLPLVTECLRGDDPVARAYAAGCFLHFFLDEQIHETIQRQKREGSSHYRLELALDALVLREQGISELPRICVRHRSSIHHMFPGLNPVHYRLGLALMAKVVDVFRKRGEGLYRAVTQKEWDQAWYLFHLLKDRIPDGAKALEELLAQELEIKGAILT